jgi:hypothetical protein
MSISFQFDGGRREPQILLVRPPLPTNAGRLPATVALDSPVAFAEAA